MNVKKDKIFLKKAKQKNKEESGEASDTQT
jgi:hypothetical protein